MQGILQIELCNAKVHGWYHTLTVVALHYCLLSATATRVQTKGNFAWQWYEYVINFSAQMSGHVLSILGPKKGKYQQCFVQLILWTLNDYVFWFALVLRKCGKLPYFCHQRWKRSRSESATTVWSKEGHVTPELYDKLHLADWYC